MARTRPFHSAPVRRCGAAAAGALAVSLLAACSSNDGGASATGSATGSATEAASTSISATTGSATPSETSPAAAGAQTSTVSAITVTATEFALHLDHPDLRAGTYTITVANQGHATHNLVVARDGAQVARSALAAPGGATSFTVTLAPGRYDFYCSVGNHQAMGMETGVTVSG